MEDRWQLNYYGRICAVCLLLVREYKEIETFIRFLSKLNIEYNLLVSNFGKERLISSSDKKKRNNRRLVET